MISGPHFRSQKLNPAASFLSVLNPFLCRTIRQRVSWCFRSYIAECDTRKHARGMPSGWRLIDQQGDLKVVHISKAAPNGCTSAPISVAIGYTLTSKID